MIPTLADVPDAETHALLSRLLGAEGQLWSIGTFAGFMGLELSGTPKEASGVTLLETGTARARLTSGARLLAFETLSSEPRGWNHGIALCLPMTETPELRDRRLSVVTGDPGAIRAADLEVDREVGREAGGEAMLIDTGLGHQALRCFFRPAPGARQQAALMAGQHWADCREALAVLEGDWITETPFLRAERQADGTCPVHAIPPAGQRGLTHAATTPVPPGWLPFAHVFPPHPARLRPGLRRPFDPGLHAAFQTILSRHGRPDLTALKADTLARLDISAPPPQGRPDRHGLAVIRVTLRQWSLARNELPPESWQDLDRPLFTALRAGA